MSVVRPPWKSPRRHAGDVAFHLQNALRSVEAVLNQARERGVYERAQALRGDLRDAKATAERLHHAVIQEQRRRETAA